MDRVLRASGRTRRGARQINSEINAILQEPEMAKRIEAAGLQTTIRSRSETSKMFHSEIENWAAMVRAIDAPKQ